MVYSKLDVGCKLDATPLRLSFFDASYRHLLYILTSVWVLHTPNTDQNIHFQGSFCKKAKISKKFAANFCKKHMVFFREKKLIFLE